MAENNDTIPAGLYKCVIEKCEPGYSKKGRPQLATWFRVIEGQYSRRVMFYYQSMANETGKKIAAEVMEKAQKANGEPVNVTVWTKQSANNPDVVFTNYSINLI